MIEDDDTKPLALPPVLNPNTGQWTTEEEERKAREKTEKVERYNYGRASVIKELENTKSITETRCETFKYIDGKYSMIIAISDLAPEELVTWDSGMMAKLISGSLNIPDLNSGDFMLHSLSSTYRVEERPAKTVYDEVLKFILLHDYEHYDIYFNYIYQLVLKTEIRFLPSTINADFNNAVLTAWIDSYTYRQF